MPQQNNLLKPMYKHSYKEKTNIDFKCLEKI